MNHKEFEELYGRPTSWRVKGNKENHPRWFVTLLSDEHGQLRSVDAPDDPDMDFEAFMNKYEPLYLVGDVMTPDRNYPRQILRVYIESADLFGEDAPTYFEVWDDSRMIFNSKNLTMCLSNRGEFYGFLEGFKSAYHLFCGEMAIIFEFPDKSPGSGEKSTTSWAL